MTNLEFQGESGVGFHMVKVLKFGGVEVHKEHPPY